MKKHLISMILVIALIIGIMPVSAFAENEYSYDSQTEDYGSFIDGSHVISDMIDKNGMYGHPRIIMTDEKFAKLRSHIGDGSVTATLLAKLQYEADRLIDKPVSEYEIPDGIRLLETSKTIQRRVAALAMAYNVFGDEKYAVRCYQELEAACAFEDWNPYHFLDPAEMCTAFAFGYDWLYDWMTPEQRYNLRSNIIEKGLEQVMNDYTGKVHWNSSATSETDRSYTWYQDKEGDNWQLVCTGGTNLAALAIGDEEDASEIASEVITHGYKKAYAFIRRAYSAQDGTYSEGLGYWDYATYYLGLQASALISATGTDYGFADYDGIRRSADFIRYMSSNTPKSFSFGDDGDSRDTGWAVFQWFGEYYNSPDMSAIRLKKLTNESFNYLDALWIDEDKMSDSGNKGSTDWGCVGASNASFRNTWDESGIVAALHAGTNNYLYHSHYDLGSFYLEYNGSRFFTDLGNEKDYELYNRQYSYRIKPEGHNTIVINPTEGTDQLEGANCLITEFREGAKAYAVTDLTEAYEPNGAQSVVRGLKMIKDKECVIIQDEITLDTPGDIYWFAHTKGEIDLADDKRSAIVTVGSDRMWVGLISNDGDFSVMKAEPLPTSKQVVGVTDNKEYRKLAVHLTDTKDTTIAIACIPLGNEETNPSWIPTVKAISDWNEDFAVKYCSLSIGDDIGLNMYTKLSDNIVNNDGANMVFSINGKETAVPVSEAQKVTIDGEEYYKFTFHVAAAYMTSDVSAQIRIVSDGTSTAASEEFTYSVREYAETVIRDHDKYGAETVKLVKAMLNYGSYAQRYFGINTEDLADKNIYNSSNDPVLDFDQNLSAYQLSSVIPQGDLEFCGASLVCDGKTSLKLYFDDKLGIPISCDRYTVNASLDGKCRNCNVDVNNNIFVVTLTGITAAELDSIYQFTVSDTKNRANTFTFNYSPAYYMANAQKTTNIKLVNLTRAMYLYNQATKIF